MRVALFPGHVGKDSGATDGLGESDSLHTIEAVVNAAIVSKIQSLYRLTGVEYSTGIGGWAERLSSTETCDIGFSIHADAIGDPNISGYHVCYYPSSTKGRDLAFALSSVLNSFLHNTCRDPHEENFLILRRTSFPCVLLECGFLTNSEDECLLNSEQYQWDIATAVLTVTKMAEHWVGK